MPKSFSDKMKTLFSDRCFVYLVFASAFRFMGGYSLGFYSGGFFTQRYPDYVNAYALAGTFVIIGGGLPAS